MSNRKLSQKFLNELGLNNGLLNPVLDRVKKDRTLDLEIRYNYINIYYRGGNILRVEELPRGNKYKFGFEQKYAIGYPNIPPGLFGFRGQSSGIATKVSLWLIALPYLKDMMDIWFGRNPKDEREYQQHIVRDNNCSGVSGSTDYFVLDIEYDNRKGNSSTKGSRYDLLAFQWNSDGVSRKLTSNTKPRLCCFEMKFGDGALTGKAGLGVHFDDFCNFANVASNISNLKAEALEVFAQKRLLGLIPGLAKNGNALKNLDDNVDYIILVANHDPAKSNFLAGLHNIQKDISKCPPWVKIKVCESSNMGYSLYKEKVISLQDYLLKP